VSNILTKPAALNENKDFRRLYGRGKSVVDPALVTYVMKNRAGFCRVGITTSKKIGNAVERNRARRVIREAYRHVQPKIKGNYDLVFVARVRTIRKKSTEIQAVMESQLKKLGLIQS
jgi:ribonuclease P protein component